MIAVEKAPFEVGETGWGEFQLNIRIVFQDANQKPLNLTHHLKLYPTSEDAATSQVKTSRPVVSEHYEEIIFDPPTVMMTEILQKEPQFADLKTSPKYSEFSKMETEELLRIEAAMALVKSQLVQIGVGKVNVEVPTAETTAVDSVVNTPAVPSTTESTVKTRNRK